MNMLVSFDATSDIDDKEENIEAYEKFYSLLGKQCLTIIHPYNSDEQMPRSTCYMKSINLENIDSFKENLKNYAKEAGLKITRLFLLRTDSEDIKDSLGA